jgi:hypothetical protein
VECAIEKPSNKLLAVTELESDTWMAEVKRIRGKKPPLAAAGVQGLREEYTRSIEPARALAAETLKLERTLNDLVHQACRLREWSNEFGPQGVPGAEVIAEAE